jgi:hypothetical protein
MAWLRTNGVGFAWTLVDVAAGDELVVDRLAGYHIVEERAALMEALNHRCSCSRCAEATRPVNEANDRLALELGEAILRPTSRRERQEAADALVMLVRNSRMFEESLYLVVDGRANFSCFRVVLPLSKKCSARTACPPVT